MEAWDPEKIVAGLELETKLDATEERIDYKGTAERLLVETAPHAAKCMIHLALYSQNEKMRFDAAKEILNRTMGRVTEQGIVDEDNDPLRNLTGEFIKDVEVFANESDA